MGLFVIISTILLHTQHSLTTTDPNCSVQSLSCQSMLGIVIYNIFRSSDVQLRRRNLSDYCSSVCLDLGRQTPECHFGVTTITLCTQRTDGELCGVIMYSPQAISISQNLNRNCSTQSTTNCSSSSSCVTGYQALLNVYGCCYGTILTIFNESLPCSQELQIPSPCPGEHACSLICVNMPNASCEMVCM